MDTTELLARLKAKGIRNVQIAKVLELPDSRIPEINDRRRALKLDEAAKLVAAFGLEQAPAALPLPGQVLRLAVRYIAQELGSSPSADQLAELTEDVRAFSLFAGDPKVRQSVEAAEGFFQALRLRRPEVLPEGPPGSDPEKTH